MPYLGCHRLIAFDLPGFGLSDAFDYRRRTLRVHAVAQLTWLLDALDLGPLPIVVASLGRMWALCLAIDAPNRVGAVSTAPSAVAPPSERPRGSSKSSTSACASPATGPRCLSTCSSQLAARCEYRAPIDAGVLPPCRAQPCNSPPAGRSVDEGAHQLAAAVQVSGGRRCSTRRVWWPSAIRGG